MWGEGLVIHMDNLKKLGVQQWKLSVHPLGVDTFTSGSLGIITIGMLSRTTPYSHGCFDDPPNVENSELLNCFDKCTKL